MWRDLVPPAAVAADCVLQQWADGKKWGEEKDQRAEKWTVLWSWFRACSWSSREYQMSEGSLSSKAFQPHFAQQRELASSDKGWMWTSQLSVAYLSEALHPSLGSSFPRRIQVPWLKYCGTLPEHCSAHCALSVPPRENDHKPWFCPPKPAELLPTSVAPGLGLGKYFLSAHRLCYPVNLNMRGYSHTHSRTCIYTFLKWSFCLHSCANTLHDDFYSRTTTHHSTWEECVSIGPVKGRKDNLVKA